MKNIIVLFSIISLLQGCYSMYVVPPTSKENADVTFEVEGNSMLGYTAGLYYLDPISTKDCPYGGLLMANINMGNPLDIKTNNPPNIPLIGGQKIKLLTMFLPANIMGQVPCRSEIEFIPQKGVSYIVKIKWKDNNCSINVAPSEDIRITKC